MSGRYDDWAAVFFRPDSARSEDIKRDLLWLLGLGLVLIATGTGLRDPWPADEPRFALIARDMIATGDWLLPSVGGDIYADKPPLYFWLMAIAIQLLGSLRWSFLLPSLLSGLACVLLIYDLGRRLWNRETGFIAAVALLFTVQFVWQARQAQIDATLCFWTTLSLYGLLRHLMLGPQWRWYCIGWAAAGFGVITKGVGFLPLLMLIPYFAARASDWEPRYRGGLTAKWLLGPAAFVAAVSVWLAPMLIAASSDPTFAAYRDEILFHQTISRYTDAWHHREPFWYFVVEVVPLLWLPLTALLPWLIPKWRRAWQQRDLRITLLTSWVLIVLAFFSASTGKRGVYVLPAIPAVALASAPYLRELASRATAQRVVFWIATAVVTITALAIPYVLVRTDKRIDLIESYDFDPLGPLIVIACGGILICALAKPRRGFAAFAGSMGVVILVVSFWINPQMDATRSGRAFVTRVEQTANTHASALPCARPIPTPCPAGAQLGFVSFKEQYLLQASRPLVHFGHARWRESVQETMDAARWLAESPQRQLVVNDESLEWCFQQSDRIALGNANRRQWFLVSGAVDPTCVSRGMPNVAYFYNPPGHRPVDHRELRDRPMNRHTHEH